MLTKPKDLRTGHSVWESLPAARVSHRPLDRHIEVDVLVVGAGITGAMVADALAATDLSVAIVDKRGPAKGSTTASTAMVLHEIDTPLIKLSRKIGKMDAIRAWRRSRLAVDAIAARLGELDLKRIKLRDTLYLAGNLLGPKELLREDQARRTAGLASRYLDGKDLRRRYGVSRAAALLSYDGIVIDPREATLALLKAASARTAKIYGPTEIVDIHPTAKGVTAIADNGRRICCRFLIFATGYELPKRVPRRGYRTISTWAIATAPQSCRVWPHQCTMWEASEPYLYLRTTDDRRIICGGEDEDFADETKREALLAKKTEVLVRKLRKLIPDADLTVDHAWAGFFGESATGLPRIGQVPEMPNCWVALGYGGNGTTYARIAADIICGALTGHPDVDADLYDF